MTNPKIEVDIAEILKDLQTGQKELLKEVFELKGDIKALDTKVEQLNVRIGNVEFANRGILIGIGVVILGGLVMLFGVGKP